MQNASNEGIDKVIATPHFIGDYDSKVTPESVKEKIDILNKEMKKQHIKLEIYSGMEVFASNDTVDRLEKGEILTLNNSRYVLIEFSFEIFLNICPNFIFHAA